MAGQSVIGALRVMLGMDSAEFEKGATSAERRTASMERKFTRFGQKLTDIGRNLTIGLTAPLTAMGVTSVNAFREQEKAVAAVETALQSMGNSVGFTSAELQKMASGLQNNSLFGDETILTKVTANMLTFGNVTGQAFERAQQSALDLSARLGQDLQSSAVMLGKALNDPVKGITALTRVGVAFTEQQKQQIRTMAEAGDVAGAQALILTELEKQYGGQAKAAAEADGGITQLRNSWGDFQEQIGAVLVPMIQPLVTGLQNIVTALQGMDEGTRKVVVGVGLFAAAVGPVMMGLGAMIKLGAPALAMLASVASGGIAAGGGFAALLAALGPLLPIIAAVAAAGVLIYANWDKIKPLLDELATSFNETLGPPLRELVSAATELFNTFWNGPLGDMVRAAGRVLMEFQTAYASVLGTALVEVLRVAIDIVTRAFEVIGGAISLVSNLLKGDFAGAWRAVLDTVNAVFPGVIDAAAAIYNGVKNWLQDRLGAVFNWVKEKIEMVEGAFAWLYDRVVGNSWIPDMVAEIGEHMGLLQGNMVDPAIAAAKETSEAFEQANERTADSFADMTSSALSSVDQLVRGIKSGGVMDIMKGLLGVLKGFGVIKAPAIGASGGGANIPGFANGGSMRLGGVGGVDRNLLSLNGQPLARVSRGETMNINPANDRSGSTVRVVLQDTTGLFVTKVEQISGSQLAQAAPAMIAAGGQAGVSQMMQMQDRMLG